MNIFGCKFCENYNSNGTCVSDEDVDKDRKNFDSLLWALVTVFQVFDTIHFKLTSEYIYQKPKKLCFSKVFGKYSFILISNLNKNNS